MLNSRQITHQYSPLITCGKLTTDHPPIFTTHHMWETHGRSPTNIHYSSHMGNSWQITHQYSLLITHGKLTKSLTNIHHSSHMVSSWQINHQYSPLITCGKLMADHPPIFTTHHTWETHSRSHTDTLIVLE